MTYTVTIEGVACFTGALAACFAFIAAHRDEGFTVLSPEGLTLDDE